MKCLITGIGGFIGHFLSEFLSTKDAEVYGIRRKLAAPDQEALVKIFEGDILNGTFLKETLRSVSPSLIFHLAAQSLPSVSWQKPQETFEINVIGTLNLLESIRENNLNGRIVFCGSSSEYAPSEKPVSEVQRLEPSSPYAASKIAASLLSSLYHQVYKTDIIIVRPFFIIGPRKTGDLCSSLARGIVDIERGKSRCLSVGNLQPVRDFLDVRDAVRAFWLVAERGITGEIYNISSGQGCKVATILEKMISHAKCQIAVQYNHAPRPIDLPVSIGTNDKLKGLGWSPEIPLDESLANILEYWRQSN